MSKTVLSDSLAAWGTPGFETVLKAELCRLGTKHLPLQQGLKSSSVALDDNINVVVLKVDHDADTILVTASLFYDGIVAGCSCADDPTPVDRQPENCEVSVSINRLTAEGRILLLE